MVSAAEEHDVKCSVMVDEYREKVKGLLRDWGELYDEEVVDSAYTYLAVAQSRIVHSLHGNPEFLVAAIAIDILSTVLAAAEKRDIPDTMKYVQECVEKKRQILREHKAALFAAAH